MRLRGGHCLIGLLFLAPFVLALGPKHEAAAAPGASIAGIVVGPDGLPLAGVAVQVRRGIAVRWILSPVTRAMFDYQFSAPSAARLAVSVVHTDKRGRFQVGGLKGGVKYEVRPRPAPPALGRVRVVKARLYAQPGLRLKVEAGRTLKGRLVDEQGRGLRGWIQATSHRQSETWLGRGGWSGAHIEDDFETASDGRFAFAVPLEGRVWVSARFPGGRSLIGCAPGTLDAQGSWVIVARVGGGAAVVGRVEDAAGAPIAGARVLVRARAGRAPGLGLRPAHVGLARTDEDGAFEVRGLPAGDLEAIAVEAPGYFIWSRAPYSTPLLAERPLDVRVTLVQAERLEVHVRDEEGRPLAGVYALATCTLGGHRQWLRRGISDASGLIVIEDHPPAPGWLQLTATAHYQGPGTVGVSTAYLAPQAGETRRVDIVLKRGETLHGRLIDAQGKPVSGAHLALQLNRSDVRRGAGSRIRRVETAADGGFVFAGIPPTTMLEVRLEDERFPAISTRVDLASLSRKAPVQIVVPPSATVKGRVLDAEDAPVSDVVVTLGGGAVSTVTGEDGTFRFEHLPLGRRRVYLGNTPGSSMSAVVEARVGQAGDGLVLRHPGTELIAGVVLDEHGQGLPGVVVYVGRKDGSGASPSLLTDAAGRFRLKRVPKGTYVIKAVGEEIETQADDDASERLRIQWKPRPSRVLEGRVLDAEGRTVPDAVLRIASPGDGLYAARAHGVVLGGRFRVRVMGERTALVIHVTAARDAAGHPLNTLPAKVEVGPAHDDVLTIRLGRALRIRGRVLDEHGQPLPGISVSATRVVKHPTRFNYVPPIPAVTNEDGQFGIPGLQQGSYRLLVTPGRAWVPPAPLTVDAGEADAKLQLVRWCSLAVHVVGPGGEPVEGCRVSIQPMPPAAGVGRPYVPRPPRGFLTPLTDAAGHLEHPWIVPGKPLVVRVDAPDGDLLYPTRLANVSPDAELVEVRLQRALSISGRVGNEQGEPLEGALVNLRRPRQRRDPKTGRLPQGPLVSLDRRALTGPEGRFVFKGLPRGVELNLAVGGPAQAAPPYFAARRDGVPTGSDDVRITLEQGVMIHGHILDVGREFLRGLRVTATPKTRGAPHAIFVFDGRKTYFILGPLRRGPHELRFSGGTDLFLPPPMVVEAPARGIARALARAYTLEGRVLGSDGGRFTVSFHTEAQGLVKRGLTRSDGRFQLKRLREAVGQLLVSRSGDAHVALVPDVRPSGDPLVVELALGQTIAGRIVGLPEGAVVGSVRVSRGSIEFVGPVRADGRFETPHLPPGPYRIEVALRRPRSGHVPTPASVEAGEQELVLEWSDTPR